MNEGAFEPLPTPIGATPIAPSSHFDELQNEMNSFVPELLHSDVEKRDMQFTQNEPAKTEMEMILQNALSKQPLFGPGPDVFHQVTSISKLFLIGNIR